MAGTGPLRLAPPSDRVDARTADDLVSGSRDFAASVVGPRIGRAERMSRLALAARNARDLRDAVPLLDPYRGTDHSRVRDQLALAGHRAWGYGVDLRDAAERIAQAAQHEELRAQVREIAWADLSALVAAATPTVAAPLEASPAAWLTAYARPAPMPAGPATEVPSAWDSWPDASIDPPAGTEIDSADGVLAGERLDWTTSATVVDESAQLVSWSPGAARELENRLIAIVDRSLEQALLAKLTDGVTASDDLEAAEAAVGATGYPADLVLAHPTDVPAVRRLYGAAGLWPDPGLTILPTIGATVGTVVVLATPAVYLEATAAEIYVADKPRELGKDVAVLRYGRAALRIEGAVATVELEATP